MPSSTEKQARTMAAAAHNPAFAKKVGIPQSVATDFNQADKGGKLLSRAMSESPAQERAEPSASPAEEFSELHQRARSRALRAHG